MFSLSRISVQASRSSICAQCLRQMSTRRSASSFLKPSHSCITPQAPLRPPQTSSLISNMYFSRTYATKSSADDLIEEIQEQYATARDEFEIATEESEKKSVYAADDRAAAREELDNLKEMYDKALEGADGEEVKRRVGQRIRELDHAIQALEESALGD